MGEHYEHNIPLHNTEPIILKKKAEVNMVITCAKSVEQEQLTSKLLDMQIRVRDTFKTSDKHQLIMNTDKVLDSLDPAKLRELQDTDQSIINLKNSRKQSVIADNNIILRIKVDHKGNTLEAILLPKVLRPWIIASTHEFCGHQGRDHCYYKKSNILLEWHEKQHLPGHLKLQNLQNGITQSGQVHELTFGNRCSTYAPPCNGYHQNQRCRLSILVHICTHRHADKLHVHNTSERHL